MYSLSKLSLCVMTGAIACSCAAGAADKFDQVKDLVTKKTHEGKVDIIESIVKKACLRVAGYKRDKKPGAEVGSRPEYFCRGIEAGCSMIINAVAMDCGLSEAETIGLPYFGPCLLEAIVELQKPEVLEKVLAAILEGGFTEGSVQAKDDYINACCEYAAVLAYFILQRSELEQVKDGGQRLRTYQQLLRWQPWLGATKNGHFINQKLRELDGSVQPAEMDWQQSFYKILIDTLNKNLDYQEPGKKSMKLRFTLKLPLESR